MCLDVCRKYDRSFGVLLVVTLVAPASTKWAPESRDRAEELMQLLEQQLSHGQGTAPCAVSHAISPSDQSFHPIINRAARQPAASWGDIKEVRRQKRCSKSSNCLSECSSRTQDGHGATTKSRRNHYLTPSQPRDPYAQPPGGGQMEASNANTILPPLLTIIQLRRTMSDSIKVNGLLVRVAAEVPPYRIVTAELAMNKTQRDLYRRIHRRSSKLMSGGGKSEANEGHLNHQSLPEPEGTLAPFTASLINKFDHRNQITRYRLIKRSLNSIS